MGEILFLIVLFLVFSLSFYLVVNRQIVRKTTKRRIDVFIPVEDKMEKGENERQKVRITQSFILSVSKLFKGINFNRGIEKLLMQAGSNRKAEEFFVIRLLTGIGFALGVLLLGLPWYVSILVFMAGYVTPLIYMKEKARKRSRLLSYQLVEALGTMSNSLRAGFSFIQTMQLIGKEMPDPIGPEFDRAVREIGMGIPVEEVFEGLLDRLNNKELEVVISAILAQRKSGGNLAELLDTMEETVRGRIRILEELKTLTAQGKLSSWIITALPLLLGAYLNWISPQYFQVMFDYPLGWFLLVTGGISLIIGWLFIQKTVRIEV